MIGSFWLLTTRLRLNINSFFSDALLLPPPFFAPVRKKTALVRKNMGQERKNTGREPEVIRFYFYFCFLL